MPWNSINPASEPESSVRLAAYIVGVTPENITSTQLASVYNEVEGQPDQNEARIEQFYNSVSSLLDEDLEEVEE